jgi:hypothetical protein
MFNEDEHQKPIHKLFYLITGTCNCGVRIRVPPPAPAGGFCQPCKPGGAPQKPNVLGMSMLERQEYLRQQRAKKLPATSLTPRACARVFAAIGVAVLAASLAWRPTVAAVASVVLVAASCVFIT